MLFVPPAYSLFVSKFEDILALVVFLVTAIMTAQLASDLRRRAEEANRRERETHILYDLVRVTNHEDGLLHQLHILRLLIDDVHWPSSENMLGIEHDTHEGLFFSTFLEQAVTVIERARLLRESVQVKVLQQTDAFTRGPSFIGLPRSTHTACYHQDGCYQYVADGTG